MIRANTSKNFGFNMRILRRKSVTLVFAKLSYGGDFGICRPPSDLTASQVPLSPVAVTLRCTIYIYTSESLRTYFHNL